MTGAEGGAAPKANALTQLMWQPGAEKQKTELVKLKATDCLIRSVEGSLVTSDSDRARVRRSNKVLQAVLKPSEGN